MRAVNGCIRQIFAVLSLCSVVTGQADIPQDMPLPADSAAGDRLSTGALPPFPAVFVPSAVAAPPVPLGLSGAARAHTTFFTI